MISKMMYSFFILLFCFFSAANAQSGLQDNNSFEGGFGMTWIDGESYTTFTLAPDFAFGKFGLGLNIELLFNNSDGFKFRKAGWDNGAGVFRAIRYLRYGHKRDRFYTRIGTLDAASLGHGILMWYYSNESAYDNRKIGLELDIDFNQFGFETVTSNLGRLEVLGGRLYYRPFLQTGIPIVKNIEFGGTYVTDNDPDSDKDTDDSVNSWALDIGVPIIKSKYFTTLAYYDFANIIDYGSGHVMGLEFGFPALSSIFSLSAKVEKRILGDEFLPNYFNALYEIDRSLGKESMLSQVKSSEGIFGQLFAQLLGKLHIVGNYQQIQNMDNSGLLHFEAGLSEALPNIRLRAYYDKAEIGEFKDIFTFDNRSLATAEIGYKTYRFVYLSMLYRWTFKYIPETDSYKPQERVEPRVSVSFSF